MIAVAVNCLVNDARRKFVLASMGCRVRRSVTPYPRRKTGLPSRTTRIAAPGALVDLRDAKMVSICVEETWAEAEKASGNSNVIANGVFKASPRTTCACGSGRATFSPSRSNSSDAHHAAGLASFGAIGKQQFGMTVGAQRGRFNVLL